MATLVSAPRLTVTGPTTVRKLSRAQAPLRVPSLPKLHGRGPLVTTKLCETVSCTLVRCLCKATIFYSFSSPRTLFGWTRFIVAIIVYVYAELHVDLKLLNVQ